MGDFFHSFNLKVPQLSSNLTNVIDNDRFWMLKIFKNYLLSLMTMGLFLVIINFQGALIFHVIHI
jgi:hypothetical protein